jgi:hypothetical protein
MGGHSFKLWHTSLNLSTGTVVTSGKLPPRLSTALPLISMIEDAPNVIKYSGADAFLKRLFPILRNLSTTMVWQHMARGARVHDRALGLSSQRETSECKSTTQYKTIASTGYERHSLIVCSRLSSSKKHPLSL